MTIQRINFHLIRLSQHNGGFYLEGGAKRLSIIGANAFDACQMSDKTRTAAQKKIMGDKWVLKINSELYELLRIEINNFKI